MISRLAFPHLIFYLRWAFLAPISYPVICACTPADICELRGKEFNRSFQQRFVGKERVSKPYNLLPRAFLLQILSPASQSQDGVKVFFFWNDNVRALKEGLENLTKRKSTSRRILTGILSNNSKFLKAWEIIRIWIKRAWNYSLI